MIKSIEQELLAHAIETIENLQIERTEDLHFYAFNEDYYIIGYYQAEQWLEKHGLTAFEAIADVVEWQQNNYGETHLKADDINAEAIVNLYVYVKGEELLSEFDFYQTINDLLNDLKTYSQYLKSNMTEA